MKKLMKTNCEFWSIHVPKTWEQLPFDHKLSYLVFGVYTFSLVSIIELFIMKR